MLGWAPKTQFTNALLNFQFSWQYSTQVPTPKGAIIWKCLQIANSMLRMEYLKLNLHAEDVAQDVECKIVKRHIEHMNFTLDLNSSNYSENQSRVEHIRNLHISLNERKISQPSNNIGTLITLREHKKDLLFSYFSR